MFTTSVALGIISVGIGSFNTNTPESLYRTVLPSVFTVRATKSDGSVSIGSGFLALKDRVGVTAQHVIDGARKVVILFDNGKEYESVGLIAQDSESDIALLRVANTGRRVLPVVEKGNLPIGKRIFTVGAARGLSFSLSEGLISQYRSIAGRSYYQMTMPVNPGNSGGPILDDEGRVAGVVVLKLKDTEGVSFSLASESLQALYRVSDITQFTPWATAWRNKPSLPPMVPVEVSPSADRQLTLDWFQDLCASLLDWEISDQRSHSKPASFDDLELAERCVTRVRQILLDDRSVILARRELAVRTEIIALREELYEKYTAYRGFVRALLLSQFEQANGLSKEYQARSDSLRRRLTILKITLAAACDMPTDSFADSLHGVAAPALTYPRIGSIWPDPLEGTSATILLSEYTDSLIRPGVRVVGIRADGHPAFTKVNSWVDIQKFLLKYRPVQAEIEFVSRAGKQTGAVNIEN